MQSVYVLARSVSLVLIQNHTSAANPGTSAANPGTHTCNPGTSAAKRFSLYQIYASNFHVQPGRIPRLKNKKENLYEW